MVSAGPRPQLRPATNEETVAIRRLVRDAHLNPFGLNWRRFTVALDDQGGVIGCVQLKPHRDGSRELASLVVDDGWRRRGLGSRLIQHVQECAGPPMWLMCRRELVPFYARHAFCQVVDDSEMTPYFRRIWRVANLFYRIFRREPELAIMHWTGGGRSGREVSVGIPPLLGLIAEVPMHVFGFQETL